MSGKIKVNIEEIFEIEERRKLINRLDLMEIEFCVDGEPIKIDPKVRKKFEFTGLNNIDFITSNYYLRRPDGETS